MSSGTNSVTAKKKCFSIVAFDPIKISLDWALQNDRQNLSFVKDEHTYGKKMARNTCKMANSYLCHFHFETEFTCSLHQIIYPALHSKYYRATLREMLK